jgi:hypothetical protein
MTNDEFQMTKEARNPKHEEDTVHAYAALGQASFVILSSFVIRHSSFTTPRLYE